MELLKLLQKKSGAFYFLLVTLGLVNSIWSSTLLLVINNTIAGTPLPFFGEYAWQAYGGLIVLSFITARAFQSYMIRLTYDLGNELGLSIFEKLRFTNYEEYQKLGEEKVRTAAADVLTMQNFPQAFILTFNAAVMVLIGVGYLFWINPLGAAVITGVLILLAVVYYLRNMVVYKDLNTVRDLANVYQQNINDFLRGFREIKMSTKRSDSIFYNHITHNRNRVKTLTVKTLIRFMGNELMTSYVWYLLIGFILFLLPVFLHTSGAVGSNFTVTLLFLMGPVGVIVSEMREFTQLEIAVERLGEFDKAVNASRTIDIRHGNEEGIAGDFDSIRFENVSYEYYDEKRAETFRLQPVNLEIRKGESIFVTGGNGSGKSTFVHLLTGLFMPQTGSIYLNGQRIALDQYPQYRNRIAAIFTDNCLFTENYNELELNRNNERLMFLLDKMQLTDIVTFDDEKGSIKADLSKGQQKRLALIYALLENKDVIVLDEWAAEQDPVFRAYFYKKIIPELRNMGKTVIAVTHDDAYFDCAGRMLRFDYGKISSDTVIPHLQPNFSAV